MDPNPAAEFSPADIALFVKWLRWIAPPGHLNNDRDYLERETWFWVSPDALDALVESSWDAAPDGEVPVLVPEDLPAVDGIMLLANPVVVASRRGRAAADLKRNEHLIAVRWSSHSEFLVVQTIHGWSQLEALTDDNDGEPPAADDPDLTVSGSALIRPDAWRGPRPTTDIDPDEPGIWGTTRTCGDGSALIVSFSAPMTWQWGRRAEPTGSSDGTIYNEAFDGFFADARSSGTWARFAAASGFAGNNPGPQLWDRLKNAARLGILEQANEFTAGMEKLVATLPILVSVPPTRSFAAAQSPETLQLPDADDMRRLVAQPPLACYLDAASLARLMHCLWGFASVPLPANTPRRVMRDIPKARRHNNAADTAAIRVMVLREAPSLDGDADTSGHRKRPRRHLVRGHWRRQWHPSLQTHRLKWIAPHLRAGRHHDDATAPTTRTVRSVQPPTADTPAEQPPPKQAASLQQHG